MEHELKTEGKLRTLTDVKEFWEHMLAPIATRQSTATLHRPPSTPFTLREEEGEEEEEEEEGYSDSWAITALPPHHSTYSPRRVSLTSPSPVSPLLTKFYY